MDGTNDYSNYTEQELQEALSSINRERYPKNYALLQKALAKFNQLGLKRSWDTESPPPSSQDGQVDYTDYSLEELEQALASVNQTKFPINHRKLLAEHAIRIKARRRELDLLAATDMDEEVEPDVDDEHLSTKDRVFTVVVSLVIVVYGTYGLAKGSLFVRGRYSADGITFEGNALIVLVVAIFLTALAMIAVVVDYYDGRDNTHLYKRGIKIVQYLAFGLMILATILQIQQLSAAT